MKVALVIFTRNERKNAEVTFPKVPKKVVDAIYVVDGNSTDGTQEYFKRQKIKVFGQEYKGIGGAFESAFRNTKEDALIIWHPDGNMDTEDIKKMVTLLKKGHQFIVASRMIKGAYNEEDDRFLKPRKWFNVGLAILVNTLWGKNGNKCTDMVQGYRAITRKAYKKLKIKIPDRVAPELEQVIRALKKNIKITEIPTIEGNRIHGETTVKSFNAGKKNLLCVAKEIFR